VRLSGFVKPIASQRRPLGSVDLRDGRAAPAAYVRSDVCVVPAAGVIGEAVVAWRLAAALTDVLGGDRLDVMQRRYGESQE
jgi:chorismate synthase